MPSDSYSHERPMTMEEAFPKVDPGLAPLGGRVMVQLKRVSNKTKSGIVVVEDTKETVKWNTQTARVHSLGPLAFKDRQSMESWREGAWVKIGDFVRVPRWNGDRHEFNLEDDGPPVVFVIFNDHELIAKVTGDPLNIKAYIL